MQNIQNVLSQEFDKVKARKSSLTTQHQILAYEFWESIGKPKKRHELPILFRLAKQNLSQFQKAKESLHALEVDGMRIRDRFTYFLWLYKNKKII